MSPLPEEETSRRTSAEAGMKEDGEYITGAKLVAAMTGVSIVMLIAMIDLSIITTVSISIPVFWQTLVATPIRGRVLLTLR